VKDVTIPDQPVALRRPIILRPPARDIASTAPAAASGTGTQPVQPAVAPQPAAVAPAAESELQRLRDELAKCHESLAQWTQAEADWNSQRHMFQLMTDNVSDFIVLLDTTGNRTWINPAYGFLIDAAPESLAGSHAFTEVHPDDQARANEVLNLVLSEGTGHQVEYRVQKKDGETASLQSEIMPLLDPNGKIESVLLLSKDLTENNKLTEALSLASTQATAAALVEGMARDFDGILTTVVGNLTIAKNLNGPHNAIAVRLNEMERSLQRARDLIEQMFSISPEQAQQKVRVAFEPAVQDAVSTVLRGTMVRAEYLFPRNLPEIEVDQEAFSHAIRNIVTNSVQAMDKGVVRFSAESIPHSQFSYRPDLPLKPGDYVCLHIQDQGHGISEKAMPRVFEPYFTTRSGSQGLGLTTALSSIQRMGGTIILDSTPGVGTTVSLYLPAASGPSTGGTGTLPKNLKPSVVSRAGGTSVAPVVPTVPAKPAQKRRILLMDDEQMILDIVSRMLGHLGYEVSTCTDGSQAIAAFAKSKSHSETFDLVMMDLVIPNGVGGQDAVHTIKKIDPEARVIASSGHLEHPVMLDHRKFGFSAVLEKPYKLEKLQQVIENVLAAPPAPSA
jgi:two-component system cell cycle sensor histidine kinase/response regulator CckA